MSQADSLSLAGMSADSQDASILEPTNTNGEQQQQLLEGAVPIVIVNSLSDTTTPASPPAPTPHCCKKRTLILILIIPLVVVCTLVRVCVNHYRMKLPMPHLTQRIIDVNSPPVDLPNGETIATMMDAKMVTQPQDKQPQHASSLGGNPHSTATATTTTHHSSYSRSVAERLQEKNIPVVVDRGEVPLGVGIKKLLAADALLCRGSVINYVINATNGKDECTGLQKAFDETCSQEEEEEAAKMEDQNEIWLGGGQPDEPGLHERRRLLTRQTKKRRRKPHNAIQDLGNAFPTLLHKATLDLYWVLDWMGVKRSKFLAENAVFRAYPKAKRRETARRRRRRMKEMVEAGVTKERESVPVEGGDDDDDEPVVDDDDLTSKKNTTDGLTATATTTEAPVVTTSITKPHNVLNLPTGHHHVSAKTLEKTLFLQQEDKVLSQVKKAVNATNVTKTTDAKEDAAASAKAVADTNELVSAVLNDPTSIEARACCASILNVYHENCNIDAEEEISDKRLFIVVLIMAFCGMVKSLIRHFKIRWLPEAAGCILVGVASGYAASFFPHQDFSFDGNWFLRILVPPIVFEAALSIDKKSFNRHLVPIIIYSTIGTVLATFLTATMVYNGTYWLGRFCETIPYIESLIFGSLISSIDPIAVLSVLGNMGMTDTDTLYVLVFGESLLNDGVAIVLFHTLVEFLDANVVIDGEAITNAVIHFFVVALGSVLVGIGSGIMCTIYYWAFHGCQTPLVEVLMFLCWALLPYYVCDGIGWSGIVSSVTVGFVMDLYVIGLRHDDDDDSVHSHGGSGHFEEEKKPERLGSRPILAAEGHLSAEARIHIHFVTEIVATMMETAIFAYLGLFLFSHRYHWNLFHIIVSIMACCISRAIMIPMLSTLANWITSMQKYKNRCRGIHKNSPATGVIVDKKMQMVLWFAGLRGAMSFALVEHIPLFDAVTGEGTRVKAELKAMTSASIMFTVFVLGGSTNYFMDYVGLSPTPKLGKGPMTSMELAPLVVNGRKKEPLNGGRNGDAQVVDLASSGSNFKTRQRLRQKDDPER